MESCCVGLWLDRKRPTLRACFVGSPHLSCKRDQIKMRNYMDRWVTPPKRVTSPTWGPPPHSQSYPWRVNNNKFTMIYFLSALAVDTP